VNLSQWCESHNVRPEPCQYGSTLCVRVFVAIGYYDLFHLDDYRVLSAVSGPSYLLVPR
jgi:hypothetical protein